MSSTSLFNDQTAAYQQLYAQHQTTRRENQHTLIEPLQQLNLDVQTALNEAKHAYEKARETYQQEFNVLKRVFTQTASAHEKQFVLPLKQIYHQQKDLAKNVEELVNETVQETAPVEVRTRWNGSIAVVYNPITGRAEWKENRFRGVHGVFNPTTGTIEWQEKFDSGVYGVYNPQLNIVEWKTNSFGSVHGVYNPSTGIVEWKIDSSSGIGGVYNPLTREVEWKTCFHGGVVGYYDYETQTVKWEEKWHHGIALISWDPNAKTYLTSASCIRDDDDD
jgi:hypothetical protein